MTVSVKTSQYYCNKCYEHINEDTSHCKLFHHDLTPIGHHLSFHSYHLTHITFKPTDVGF